MTAGFRIMRVLNVQRRTKPLIILLVFFVTGSLFAQTGGSKKEDSRFLKDIRKINSLLEYYHTLSPFSDDDERFQNIDSARNDIVERLIAVLNNKSILNYGLDTLFNEDELFMRGSKDKRLYFISIDEKTGGSYRTSVTLIHYRLPGGSIKTDYFSGEESEAFATSTYGGIYQPDSSQLSYFVTGGVRTCNTCYAAVAFTLRIDSAEVIPHLVAQYDGRDHNLELFKYDEKLREFSYHYQTEDYNDPMNEENADATALQHKFRSLFRYYHGEFIEIEKCEFIVTE